MNSKRDPKAPPPQKPAAPPPPAEHKHRGAVLTELCKIYHRNELEAPWQSAINTAFERVEGKHNER